MDIVPTIIMPPRAAHQHVIRGSIESLAAKVSASRVTTVVSPAGFGKTMVMLRWADLLAQQGRPVMWIAARAGVDSLEGFIQALAEASALVGLGASSDDPRKWLASLSDQQRPRPVLFIDDGQLLPPDVIEFISQLIFSARDQLTTVIASRGEVPIELARLRSLGYLEEVRVRHLSFDADEAGQLVRQVAGEDIGCRDVDEIVSAAQGWAAGLIVAATAWRNNAAEPASECKAIGLRYDFGSYFHEEVLDKLPQDIRDFLVDVSILDDLPAAACAAVVQRESASEILEDAFCRGAFLMEVDREQGRFRMYNLFRLMVCGRLMLRAPDRASRLHKRASAWFAEQGDFDRSIAHAEKCADKLFLAEQIEVLAENMIYSGLLYRLDELASRLPWELLEDKPATLLAMSWRRSRQLAFSSAQRLLDAAEVAIAKKVALGELNDHASHHLDFHFRHRKIMLEAARDNMTFVEQESTRLLQDLGDEHPYLSCTLLAQLLSARRELYHFHDMLRLEAELRKALARPGSAFASIALKSSVAPTLVAMGKTQSAMQFLLEAQEIAAERDSEVRGLSALPSLPLAEILYDFNELEEAATLVERYLPSIRQWGFVDQIASGYLVRARLAAANGNFADAVEGLREAHLVAIECGLDRLRALVISEQVRILIRNGQAEQAEHLFVTSDLEMESEPVPTLNPSRLNEWLAIAWLRIEMQNFRLIRARKIARRWLELVRKRGAVRSALTFELLLAEIEVLSGNRFQARRYVRSAVELAEPAGWIRPFLDEGEAIASLLIEAYGEGPVLDNPVDKFAVRLVANLKGEPHSHDDEEPDFGASGGLSHREIEILSQVGGGLRNREIGVRLGLTEGTVKWYMQQIYDKLGVRRRPQAVLRARQLGILT